MSWGTTFEIVPEGRKFTPDIFAISEVIKNMGKKGVISSTHGISNVSISNYHDQKLIKTEKLAGGGTHNTYEEMPSVNSVFIHISLTKDWANRFIKVIEEDTGIKHDAEGSPFVNGQDISVVFRNRDTEEMARFGVNLYILHGVKEKLIKTRKLVESELLPIVEKAIGKKCTLDAYEG